MEAHSLYLEVVSGKLAVCPWLLEVQIKEQVQRGILSTWEHELQVPRYNYINLPRIMFPRHCYSWCMTHSWGKAGRFIKSLTGDSWFPHSVMRNTMNMDFWKKKKTPKKKKTTCNIHIHLPWRCCISLRLSTGLWGDYHL